jgi:hypothetical protein
LQEFPVANTTLSLPVPPRRAPISYARGLGWFSVALGIVQLLKPRAIGRGIGVDSSLPMRLCGMRELTAGVGLLGARDPGPWVAARVAGDALDLLALASVMRRNQGLRWAAVGALGAVAAVTLLDMATAEALRGHAQRERARQFDYSDRSGFPRPASEMSGIARQTVLH